MRTTLLPGAKHRQLATLPNGLARDQTRQCRRSQPRQFIAGHREKDLVGVGVPAGGAEAELAIDRQVRLDRRKPCCRPQATHGAELDTAAINPLTAQHFSFAFSEVRKSGLQRVNRLRHADQPRHGVIVKHHGALKF